jgi:threonine 3-dehydrogenase
MEGLMKGVIKERPEAGEVYREDLPVPQIGSDDVLVKIHVATLCGSDLHVHHWNAYAQKRITPPRIIGHEAAGEIVEIGDNVKNFKVGDRVTFDTHTPCGACLQCLSGNQHICESWTAPGYEYDGVFAEYACLPKTILWKLDDSISYKVGAMLEPFGIAVRAITHFGCAGKNVLVVGSGPIGVMAVAVAKKLGAFKVFAVDLFDKKLELAKTMGADVVYNSRKDYIPAILTETGGKGVELIVDMSGSEHAIMQSFDALKTRGQYVFAGMCSNVLPIVPSKVLNAKEATLYGFGGRLMWTTWLEASDLIKNGLDLTPVIGETYAFRDFKKAIEANESGEPGKMQLVP